VKYLIPVLCAVALLAGCAKEKKDPVVDALKPAVEAPKVVGDYEKLERRDGLWYFEGKAFTGIAGLKHENGQKKTETTYKDGKEHGLYTEWRENGRKFEGSTYKDGKRHGLYTRWYGPGQKSAEGTYKDGKLDGLWTEWYSNGQKQWEFTFKEGKRDGLHTHWHKNGQKEEERTFKNGKKISEKHWDEDGTPW
jgi:antitoxin component YwqK of YwqJK toxin-antitoxin module